MFECDSTNYMKYGILKIHNNLNEIAKYLDCLFYQKDIKVHYFVDFDCTLVQSLIPVVNNLNKKYGTNVTPEQIKSWNFKEINPNLSDDEIEEIFTISDFFKELKFYDGAKEWLQSHENYTTIVTKGKPLNIYNKHIWLKEQGFNNIQFIGLDLNTPKSLVNMQADKNTISIFIDDSTNNLNCSNANIKIQFREFGETEWNKGWDGMVINSWI